MPRILCGTCGKGRCRREALATAVKYRLVDCLPRRPASGQCATFRITGNGEKSNELDGNTCNLAIKNPQKRVFRLIGCYSLGCAKRLGSTLIHNFGPSNVSDSVSILIEKYLQFSGSSIPLRFMPNINWMFVVSSGLGC